MLHENQRQELHLMNATIVIRRGIGKTIVQDFLVFLLRNRVVEAPLSNSFTILNSFSNSPLNILVNPLLSSSSNSQNLYQPKTYILVRTIVVILDVVSQSTFFWCTHWRIYNVFAMWIYTFFWCIHWTIYNVFAMWIYESLDVQTFLTNQLASLLLYRPVGYRDTTATYIRKAEIPSHICTLSIRTGKNQSTKVQW